MKYQIMKTVLMCVIVSLVLDFWFQYAGAQSKQSHPAFNHVYLAVRNIDSSIKFYAKAFDLKVTDHFTQLDIVQSDSSFKRTVNIAFLKFPGQDFVYELAERPDKNDTARPGNLFQHVGVEVTDINSAFQRVLNAGGKIVMPIRQVKTNSALAIKQAFMKGPDGETIELVEIIAGEY